MYHIKDDKRATSSAQLIEEGLIQLIQRKPYSLITISELTHVSGVGRTTFYRCFDTLDDVIRLRCDRSFKAFELHLRHAIKSTHAPIGFTLPFLDYWDHDSKLIELVIKIDRLNLFKEAFHARVNAMKMDFALVKDKHIQAYMQDIKIEVAVALLIRWIQEGKQLSSKQLVSSIHQAFIEAQQTILY